LVFYTAATEGAHLSLERLAFVCSWADPIRTRTELSKASALVALSLLSLSLVAGPLHRMSPSPRLLAVLRERRRLGLAASAFAAVHAALSLGSWRALVDEVLRSRELRLGGLAASTIALCILLLMAATSTRRATGRLGAARWKRLHRLGAPALALSAVHFACMETDPVRGLRVRTYGFVVLACAVVALVVRGLSLVVAARQRHAAADERPGG
jgi:DMSO/TMAO reductase YedYZ heme-binding membrane subunit